MDDIPLDGKRVIVRADFNVTVGADKVVDATEDYRIEAALPTIQELRQRRCKVLILAHRGHPVEEPADADMKPIKRRLEELLGEEVRTLPKLYGSGVEAIVSSMDQGTVALYPNVRLDDREELASEKMGEEIVQAADAYINEAFSVSHRPHTSVTVLPRLVLSAAGRRVVMEVKALGALQNQPARPYVAIVSGAKITTKIGMLRRLLAKVDTLAVGGQIANVFLAARGNWPGVKFNADEIEAARSLLEVAGVKLLLPIDVMIGGPEGENASQVAIEKIPDDAGGLWDIGSTSTAKILDVCRTAKTIMWNGPVGKFEVDAYAGSTKSLAEEIANMSANRVVGGGDTVNALEKYKVVGKYNHVSVGGAAMIAFMEGKRMPGLEPLYIISS